MLWIAILAQVWVSVYVAETMSWMEYIQLTGQKKWLQINDFYPCPGLGTCKYMAETMLSCQFIKH